MISANLLIWYLSEGLGIYTIMFQHSYIYWYRWWISIIYIATCGISLSLRITGLSQARSYEVLHLSRKIILAKLKIWCSKMQLVSGNQRPDLRISLIEMSLDFWPSKAKKPWTNTVSRDYLLAHLDVFSPDSFSSDSFSSDSFSSLTALTTAATSVDKSEILLLSFLRV